MILDVTQYGDKILREVCAPVTDTAGLDELAKDMLETMYATHGIGLAAPQINKAIRMVVIDLCPPAEDEEDEQDNEENGAELCTVNGEERTVKSLMPLVFINPELEPYGKSYLFTEGCLSVRNIRSNVARPERVKAKLTLLDGSVLEIDCGGLLARCLQHECDHLDGHLFVDRVSSAARLMLTKKLKKLAAERY